MTEKKHALRLEQIGTAAFEATSLAGGSLVIDGAAEIGGEGKGMRPMEVLLSALASCSAMDVLHILRKQKEPVERLQIEIEGVRADAVPAPFTRIELVFTAHGPVDPHKLQRAVGLAVDKYCSVRASLDATIEIRWSARVAGASQVVG
jgi:putative redox protein